MKIFLLSLALLGWVSLVQADWCDGNGHCWPDVYPYPNKREASSVEGLVEKREAANDGSLCFCDAPDKPCQRCIVVGFHRRNCREDPACKKGGRREAAVGPYPYPGKREASSEEGSVVKRESAMRPRVGSCRCTAAQDVCLSCTTNDTTCSQVPYCIGGEGEGSFKPSSETEFVVKKSCRCAAGGPCLNCPPNKSCEKVPNCTKSSSEEGLVVKREAMMPPKQTRCTCRGPGDCKRCHLLTGKCRKVRGCSVFWKRGAVEEEKEGAVAVVEKRETMVYCSCDCKQCGNFSCKSILRCRADMAKNMTKTRGVRGAPQPYEAVPVPMASSIDN